MHYLLAFLQIKVALESGAFDRSAILTALFVAGIEEHLYYKGTAEKNHSSLGGLEPPTFRLTAERANRLRHRDVSDKLSFP